MKITSHMTSAKALGVFTLIAVLGLLSLPRAEAATLYWDTGGSSGQWDTATTSLWSASLGGGSKGTWSGLSGTDAVFSATTTTLAQAVTVSGGVTANSIEIKQGTTVSIGGTSTPSITLGAGGITIGSTGGAFQFLSTLGTTATSGVILSASQSWTLNKASGSQIGGSNAASITGAAGTAVTLTIAGTGAGGSTFGGIIRDGTGGGKLAFTYSGAGQISMAGANTYSGNTTLNGTGEVIATVDGVGSSGNATSGAFGAGTVLVNGASAVKMRSTGNGNRTVFNSVTLAGDIQFVTNDKSLTLAGPVTITGSTRTISTDISGNTTATPALGIISGNIGDGSNGFGLTKSGGGMLILTGNNTYSGDTRIGNGTMALGAASGTGTLALQNTTVDLNAADVGTIQFGTSNATTTTSATFGGLKGSRNLALTNANASPAAVALTVGGNNGNTTYSGNLTGTGGSLTKSGSGTLTLSGTNTYTGTTAVSTGTLLINGSTSSSSIVTVASTGTLGGTGTVGGATTISGTHNPGNSPGIQTFSSDLTYSGGASVVNWELKSSTTTNAANPGAIFDTIVVNGNLDFAGATALNLSFVPTDSNVLWSDSFWDTSRTGTSGWLLYDLSGANTVSNFSSLSLASSNWLDSGSFAFNTARPGASFTVVQSDNDIYLNYTAVPEPATWVLAFSGISFVLVARRLRHRC